MKGSFRNIEFPSQGVTLRGRMYLPSSSYRQKHAVVVMAHGFTSTISNMTADKYAEQFCNNGLAVLLYDHRNFGISDGEPRHQINFWTQARGYIDAIDYLCLQPEINKDQIALWGASMSARQAFLVGAVDDRAKAIITMIPAFGDDFPMGDTDGTMYDLAKRILLHDDILALPHSTTEAIAVVSHDQSSSPSRLKELTAFRWFMEYGGRFGTNWSNTVSFCQTELPETFHPGLCSVQIKAPILMVVAENDEMKGANPEVARHIFEAIAQPKEWVDIGGGHFGLLYYPSDLFDQSSQAQIEFLNKYLIEPV